MQACTLQMQYFLAVLRGKLSLPSREEMFDAEKLAAGVTTSKAHYMLASMFSYYDKLKLDGQGTPLPRWYEPSFWIFYDELLRDPTYYREENLYVYDDGRIEFH